MFIFYLVSASVLHSNIMTLMSDFQNHIEWKMKMCLESGMRVYTAVLQYVGIIQELRDTLAYY